MNFPPPIHNPILPQSHSGMSVVVAEQVLGGQRQIVQQQQPVCCWKCDQVPGWLDILGEQPSPHNGAFKEPGKVQMSPRQKLSPNL